MQAALAGGHGVEARIRQLGQFAALALHDELVLAPKPGLVSFNDTGSHTDMNALTFMRSIIVLRPYFRRMVWLGYEGTAFDGLRREGVAAEAAMLRATAGVNTHRGAIFSLGLLCAAAGACLSAGDALTPRSIRSTLVAHWSGDLARHASATTANAGSKLARLHGLKSASVEASLGLPVLFNTVYPQLQQAIASGWSRPDALLASLFNAMAVLDDTNLVARGGLEGLHFVRACANDLLMSSSDAGSMRSYAWKLHAEFMRRRLSPGGSADLLACASWLHRVCG